MNTAHSASSWSIFAGLDAQSQPRRHVGKACERCRQQKIKCNGELPCGRCVRLSIPCIMRRVARQRSKRPEGPGRPEDSQLIRIALKPVRIRDDTTGKTAVYGPTSTVALLHAIASRNRTDRAPCDGDSNSAGFAEADVSIDALKYLPFFLGNYNSPLTQDLSLSPQLCLTTIPNEMLRFFLARYVGTAWLMLPMQSPAQLGALFQSSYNAFGQNSPPPLFHPLMLYQLAMGALSTVQGELGEMLAQEGELFASGGEFLSGEMELQLDILKVQYHSELGSFDKAYSILGHIASRVYATGLYLEPRSPAVERLLGVLIARESHICIALGRPPILGSNIQVSNQDSSPHQKFISGLFRICTPILCMQQPPAEKFDQLWSSVWTIHGRLKTFWQENEPILRSRHADLARQGISDESIELNTAMYEYIVLTSLKPLLLYLGYKNAMEANEISPSSSQTESSTSPSPRLVTKDPRLSTASECILFSARKMISTVCGICERGSISKDLPLHSFFLESACISLISYAAWHGNSSEVWESIDSAVQCLEGLQYQRPAVMRLAAIRVAIEQSGLERV
ncbi:hypothetical protein BDW59DRAFT_131540 [Aspergillus cavernicola]|uniref:Zn(2)-C6 fungal-type domain-containing protein n=1 Tax=Aspergillus cavernicola TaxID=176166 RepID=A0ABR4IWA0_9EURO